MQDKQTENVLIVDDIVANLILLGEIVKKAGYVARPVKSVHQAMEAIDALMPDLILLDISMPDVDGFEYCGMLKKDVRTRDIPVIFISAMASTANKMRGFQLGAVDFIIKPFEEQEVYMRINTHMKLYRLQRELEKYNKQLQRMVNEQVKKISEEQQTVIYLLAKLAEGRDNSSGNHLYNVAKNCRLMAMAMQLSPKFDKEITNEFIDTIELAAPLHDIGKVTLHDNILLKPGKLTPEEMEVMKTHSEVGAQTLLEIYSRNKHNVFLKMAIDIAYYHHERWDGEGYPKRLKGTEIPLSARIMSIVDVYDTLIGVRCYKEAYTNEQALEIINNDSGKQFDPDIVDIFNRIQKQLKR